MRVARILVGAGTVALAFVVMAARLDTMARTVSELQAQGAERNEALRILCRRLTSAEYGVVMANYRAERLNQVHLLAAHGRRVSELRDMPSTDAFRAALVACDTGEWGHQFRGDSAASQPTDDNEDETGSSAGDVRR